MNFSYFLFGKFLFSINEIVPELNAIFLAEVLYIMHIVQLGQYLEGSGSLQQQDDDRKKKIRKSRVKLHVTKNHRFENAMQQLLRK